MQLRETKTTAEAPRATWQTKKKGKPMNIQLRLRRIGTVLAVASSLWFASALIAVGDSPIERFNLEQDGVYYPLFWEQGLAGPCAVVGFPDDRNDFIRTNPDESHWVHFQAVNAYLAIGYFHFEGAVPQFKPLFEGIGKATGSFTVEWVEEIQNWTADLRRLEFRWDATLTEAEPSAEQPGGEYPFFLHAVVKNGVFLREDLRFAPLGLGD